MGVPVIGDYSGQRRTSSVPPRGPPLGHQLTTTGAGSAPAAPITAADQARIDQALRDARASNTRRQYRSAWKGWAEWAGLLGHQMLPADPAAVAAYLAERTEQGGASAPSGPPSAQLHRDQGADDPTAHDGVRRVLQGLTRQAAGRGRGQAITAGTGRGMENETAAAERGAVDKAIVSLLFQGGLRRSEAAALRWVDVQDATDGPGIVVYVRRSKTDQDGTAADVRYLKNGCAVALRQLRDRITVQRSGLRPDATAPVLGGLNGQSIARRLTAAARAAGIEGRITGHSGRVGLASELTTRGASTTESMLAGGWKTARMVAHYSAAATAEQGAVAKYL